MTFMEDFKVGKKESKCLRFLKNVLRCSHVIKKYFKNFKTKLFQRLLIGKKD